MDELRVRRLAVGLLSLALFAACSDDGAGSGGSDGSGAAADGSGGEGAASETTTSTTTSTTGSGDGGSGTGGEAPASFLETYPLDAQFPESGTYDADDHVFYVGSLADGSIHRIDAATGAEETFFEPSEPGAWWTLGMTVDPTTRRLWVCAMEDLSDSGADPAYDGYVWLFDLETGTREEVFPLSSAYPEGTCTDVAVAADGTAYVTDRDFGNVYAVHAEYGPSLFSSDSDLEASIVGQNAAVVLPDQSALIIAIYLPSRLVRVDLSDGTATDIAIEGSFADATFLAGADGMTYQDGALYVAFTSELVRVTPTLADWTSVVAEEVEIPSGMTDVVSTPNGLYLLNGQAVSYALGEEPEPFALTRFTGNF
ncbi:MAG: hypothetical protein HOV80_30735 [Polyangiaceae bacterium]|nr:hypothetical protein [Polyangiaceae bacterium]